MARVDGIFRLLLESFRKYFRIDVHGLENVPRRGKALIAPNHSGCSGLDAVMLGYVLHKSMPRIPRILTLWDVFRYLPFLAPVAERMGLKPASTDNGIGLLRKNNLVIVFPEGEAGSFKPTSERYLLRRFRTGFIRMAILASSPIVPCVIIGAEESNINLGTVRWHRKHSRATLMPLPFNLLPLPAKWDIWFFPPIDVSGYGRYINDKAKLQEVADKIHDQMQAALNAELSRRKYVYLKSA